MKRQNQINRRYFLKTTAATVVLAPTIVPSSILGANGSVSPSNRITVGCIGTGPQGQAVMGGFLAQKDAQVVAICDVKQDQREQACQNVNRHYQNQDCKVYEDFRELLARRDIDACLVATPDHWHVLITVAAMKSGKDVYMEKPMGHTLAEDQTLRAAARKYNRIFQFGTQQRSDRNFRIACELARNERIGKLKTIWAWAPGSSPGGSTRQVPPPPGLNYDFWLGPAPFKPYTEDRCSHEGRKKTWWFIRDYALGFISGWGIHPMDIAVWGAGPLISGPIEVEGQGHYPTEGACDTATTWEITYRFASGINLIFIGVPNGGNSGKPTGETWAHEAELRQKFGALQHHGTAFEGTDGWVMVDRGRLATGPETLATTGTQDLKIPLKRSSGHVRDFLDSIKGRQPTVSNIEESFVSDCLCHIGDAAARLGRKLVFDLKSEKFLRDRAADALLAMRQMRKPWRL